MPKRGFPKSFHLYDNPVLSLNQKLKNFPHVARVRPLFWLVIPGNQFCLRIDFLQLFAPQKPETKLCTEVKHTLSQPLQHFLIFSTLFYSYFLTF